jgi:hypothetical protein
METPPSISNSAAAATLIQRAFRGAQKRIAAEQAELVQVLNALEEANEARINARASVMNKVNRTLEDFITNASSSLRGGGETQLSVLKLNNKSLEKKELPALTVGSIHNLITGLENDERVAMVDALAILQAATVMLMSEPSVCDITVPEKGKCTLVGDLHGQLVRAMSLLFLSPRGGASLLFPPSFTRVFGFRTTPIPSFARVCPPHAHRSPLPFP